MVASAVGPCSSATKKLAGGLTSTSSCIFSFCIRSDGLQGGDSDNICSCDSDHKITNVSSDLLRGGGIRKFKGPYHVQCILFSSGRYLMCPIQ